MARPGGGFKHRATFREMYNSLTDTTFQQYLKDPKHPLTYLTLAHLNAEFKQYETGSVSLDTILDEFDVDFMISSMKIGEWQGQTFKSIKLFGTQYRIEIEKQIFYANLASTIRLWLMLKRGGMQAEKALRSSDGWVKEDGSVMLAPEHQFQLGPWRDTYLQTSEADIYWLSGNVDGQPWAGSVIHGHLLKIIESRNIPPDACRVLDALSDRLEQQTDQQFSLALVDIGLTASPQLLNMAKPPTAIHSSISRLTEHSQIDEDDAVRDARELGEIRARSRFNARLRAASDRRLAHQPPDADHPFFDDRRQFEIAVRHQQERSDLRESIQDLIKAHTNEMEKAAQERVAEREAAAEAQRDALQVALQAAAQRHQTDREADREAAQRARETDREAQQMKIQRSEQMIIELHQEVHANKVSADIAYETLSGELYPMRCRVLESARVWRKHQTRPIGQRSQGLVYRDAGNEAAHAASIDLDVKVAEDHNGLNFEIEQFYGVSPKLLRLLSFTQGEYTTVNSQTLPTSAIWANVAHRQLAIMTVHCYFWMQHQLCNPERLLTDEIIYQRHDTETVDMMLPLNVDDLLDLIDTDAFDRYVTMSTTSSDSVPKLSEIMIPAKETNKSVLSRVYNTVGNKDAGRVGGGVKQVEMTPVEIKTLLRFCQVTYLVVMREFKRRKFAHTGIRDDEWERLLQLMGDGVLKPIG